jgi:hypothetical protein
MGNVIKGENTMTAQSQVSDRTITTSTGVGANLVTLAGVGLIGYGVMFLIRTFNGFIELGLTSDHIGGTPEQIQAFSPHLYNYIVHLQVALSGFLIALGVAVIALAVYGIRQGESWALWTAFLTPVIAVGIALPLHFSYHIGTIGHLGLIYLDAAVLLAGTVVAYRAMKTQ